ncbi:thioredoxin-like protein [Myxozyma melibiosi]|uniref:Thioredoxin-like protein n=1 Tax=Myxozyma melibiosi TaxID=54550 RepID=A0ABR1F847_9ASCO
MDDEEKIANFCAITDSDATRATQYLAVCDGDLDRAINFFLESGGASLDSAPSASAQSSAQQEPIDLDGDDDAALAERLQREENQRQEPEVRERIAPRTETLVEDFGYNYAPPIPSSSRPMRPSVFNQVPGMNPRNLTEKQSRLEQLFRPPFDIMSTYDIDTAKEKGREQKKWLLVNVQDLSDFNCQVLNRDFWSDEAVKETVRANFIFMQYNKDAYDGQAFLALYPSQTFPYVGILDPRTGEEMKTWHQLGSPADWVTAVHEFLERFSLDPRSRNPIGKVSKHKPLDHMSEEEQIRLALEQSMGRGDDDSEVASEMSSVSAAESADESLEDVSSAASSARDKGKRKIEVIDLDEDEKMDEDEPLTSEDVFATIQPVARDEPAPDPKTTTRVQIRLSDGSRKIRRLNLTDPVRYIFEYVKSDVPEMNGKYFQIISTDRKKLIDQVDQTIEEAGLKNASVLVEAEDD